MAARSLISVTRFAAIDRIYQDVSQVIDGVSETLRLILIVSWCEERAKVSPHRAWSSHHMGVDTRWFRRSR